LNWIVQSYPIEMCGSFCLGKKKHSIDFSCQVFFKWILDDTLTLKWQKTAMVFINYY